MLPKLLLVLSENWTMTSPRDMRALTRIAVEAEQAGVDGVMLSEHVVLGPTAGARGIMENPRDYAYPGNQDPAMPWPSSMVLLSAIAAVTERLRLVAGAIIAPLRHPLLLAKDLGTLDLLAEGRLVVLPTVSWHEDEYAALGVPFGRRGAVLDEQLEILERCWRPGPVSYHGKYYSFADVWVEPRPFRPEGPVLWFGGQRMHPALLRRLVRWGSGFNPLGTPSAGDLAALRDGLVSAGRDPDDMEMIGGIRGRFPGPGAVAELEEALALLPGQLAAGFGTICFKPSMYVDDARDVGALCRRLARRVGEIAAESGVRPAPADWLLLDADGLQRAGIHRFLHRVAQRGIRRGLVRELAVVVEPEHLGGGVHTLPVVGAFRHVNNDLHPVLLTALPTARPAEECLDPNNMHSRAAGQAFRPNETA